MKNMYKKIPYRTNGRSCDRGRLYNRGATPIGAKDEFTPALSGTPFCRAKRVYPILLTVEVRPSLLPFSGWLS